MKWINEPSQIGVPQDMEEGKGGCGILDFICRDLCLANCSWCAVYVYSPKNDI